MSDSISRRSVLRLIERYINGLEPHGHPAMGEDEVKIRAASIIAKMVEEIPSEPELPIISCNLRHGAGGTLIDHEGNLICTMNLNGKMSLAQAFFYAEQFIKSVNESC